MTAVDTDLLVLDVVTRWSVDAAVLLVTGASFFAAGLAGEGAARGIISGAVGFVIGTLSDRLTSSLPSPERLASAAAPPDGFRRASLRRYILETVCSVGVLYALFAGLMWVWGNPSMFALVGGWLAAFGVVRIYGAAGARRIERLDQVVLLVGIGSWRKRTRGYYASRITR
jgi:hypothetical protein